MFLLRVLAGALSFAVVLSAILWAHADRKWQATLVELRAAEAPAPYLIERGTYGVPTVYGKTDGAVAFGLAYAHAEDDFPTIQERLGPIKGELGAMQGPDGAVLDVIGRMLQIRKVTAEKFRTLSPGAQAMAAGYAAGINAYAADHPDEVLHKDLFPVHAEDIIAGFVLVSPFFHKFDDVLKQINQGTIEEGDGIVGSAAEARGSNAFALAPGKMADGSTVLISNSHQPWEGPLAWYEARLASGEGWSMAGPLFPGVPFILMGYNEHLSWTNTVNVPDLVDVYRLELDSTGRRYRFEGSWRDLESESFWLGVKFGPLELPVRQTVWWSVHGPVLKTDKGAYAVRYAGFGEVAHFEQYYRLNRATSLDEWMDAMKMQAIPSTNFIYADREGNIAYLYNGKFPERSPEVDWSGVLAGDRRDLIWTDYEPFDRQPFYLNPESGYLVNANNTPFLATAREENLKEDGFSDLVGIESVISNRIVRALELFYEHRGAMTDEDLLEIKYDTGLSPHSPLGSLFVSLASDPALASYDAEAAALLSEWDFTFDGEGPADSLAALVVYDLYLGMRRWHPMPSHEEAITEAAEHLRRHFGRLDPPMTEVSRLRRGEEDLPLTGGPDILKALYWAFDEDGRMPGINGDSYIAYVKWDEDGSLTARTVYPFGAAMARPESPHYDDQAPLFAEQMMKPAPVPDWRKAAALGNP